MRRRPKMSPSEPPSRMSAARVIRYPVRTHGRPDIAAPRSLPMAGSATLTTVASSAAMPDPSTVATRIHRPAGVPYRTASVVATLRLEFCPPGRQVELRIAIGCLVEQRGVPNGMPGLWETEQVELPGCGSLDERHPVG